MQADRMTELPRLLRVADIDAFPNFDHSTTGEGQAYKLCNFSSQAGAGLLQCIDENTFTNPIFHQIQLLHRKSVGVILRTVCRDSTVSHRPKLIAWDGRFRARKDKGGNTIRQSS